MSVNFGSFYTILAKTSNQPLPQEVVEVCHLSQAEYEAIYKALSQYGQSDLAQKYQVVKRHVEKLDALTATGVVGEPVEYLRSLAIDNLQAIRSYQNEVRLLHGLPPSLQSESLRMSYNGIPLEARADVVAKLLSVLGQLPSVHQRQTALEILTNLAPEDRQEALGSIVFLAGRCDDEQHSLVLARFVAGVSRDNLLRFLNDLSPLLARVPSNQWQEIQTLLIGNRQLATVQLVRPLLPPEGHVTMPELQELLRVVIEFCEQPEALLAAIPLVALCADGSDVSDIVRHIAEVDPEERGAIIQDVVQNFRAAVPSRIVHVSLHMTMAQFAMRRAAVDIVVYAALLELLQRLGGVNVRGAASREE